MGRAFEFRKARKMKRWSKMAKTFTRIGKDIVMAVKDGGSDPDSNSRLRQVMQNAKTANMPKDNVLRAIKKASDKDTANYEEMSLEGYAVNGIAIFVDCATNNNNRTVADVRSYFSKCEGALGTNGSLEFIFNRKGVFTLSSENINMSIDDFEMELIDAGLEELEIDSEAITIYCDFIDFNNMQIKLEDLKIEIINSELQRIPNNYKKITVEQSKNVLKLLDLLEENDDVQQVFHNMELSEEIMMAMDN
ncbi:MAG: YebC/PmpR family DNA-binding transcriptional regulator [Flavobacteriales bacterium]|jgi:YebC/PmpR family DNA-binding regulatory protein|nr:YebC/PmpR family DNA-binding transcriptional regulator [Flavobacteriales bacterium]MDG1426569.1 YebC/PmpR family DNA-binding transcriptional regulator [Flavobacteriales bacterium]MDG1934457.1 YebC/PmpR family DNA-binding transcriptional regulator [Flavobacteriales bacterium]MDG2086936.1 YebC/PmpR family DNA-binding transcriptional regulator [Flavobacteriales bacterium]|tara:strand:+ start:2390 stop:3136 length:747 start_codon:yes stop_codon:yes gene_type:complete